MKIYVQLRNRDEELKKITKVISLNETFRISAERYINMSIRELPDNFTDGWYIYTLLPTETNWSNCDKWRVEKFHKIDALSGPRYEIHAEHISCELLDESKKTFKVENSTAINALTQVLSETNWSVGVVDVSGNRNLEIKKRLSVLDVLNRIASRWKGELFFRNDRKVNFRTQIGSNNNLWFRYNKNIENIDVEYNSQGVVTRLFPYGKNGLDISSVNAGLKYLDSSRIDDYPRPKVDSIDTQHEDAQELKDYALDYLSIVEIPKVIYSLDVVNLAVLAKYAAEEFEMGDVVTVFNKELNIKDLTRIKEIRRNYCYPERNRIILANTPKMLSDFIAKLQKNISQYIPAAIDGEPWEDVPLAPVSEFPIVPVIYVGGNLRVGIYQGPVVWMHTSCTALEIMVYLKWIPIAGDVTITLNKNGESVGQITIPQGEYVAPGEGEVGAGATLSVNFPLNPFDRLNIDIDAIVDSDGDGNGIIVQVRCVK